MLSLWTHNHKKMTRIAIALALRRQHSSKRRECVGEEGGSSVVFIKHGASCNCCAVNPDFT
jgi:hypothetical protein